MQKKALAVVAAAAAVIALLAGCGSGNTAKKAPQPTDNGALSGADLGTRALALLKSARSFRVVAHSGSTGGKFAFDMRYGRTGSRGKVTLNKVSAELLGVDGNAYVKASAAFWQAQLQSMGMAPYAPMLSGKWVRMTATTPAFAQLVGFTKKSAIVGELAADADPITFSRGPRKTIHGVATVSFIETSDGTTVYVRASGTPYPVLSQGGRAQGGAKATFSEWNAPFTAEQPPADQVLDIKSLGKR